MISWDGKKFESSRLLIGASDNVWVRACMPSMFTETEEAGCVKSCKTIKTIVIRDATGKVVAQVRISGTATSGVAEHTGPGNTDENLHKVMQCCWFVQIMLGQKI